jgi:hypothetical protein
LASIVRLIKAPTPSTIDMLTKRMSREDREEIMAGTWDAVGLVRDNLPNMFAMADIADKAARVVVREIRGICPQHFGMLGIFGDTAAVQAALAAITESSLGSRD